MQRRSMMFLAAAGVLAGCAASSVALSVHPLSGAGKYGAQPYIEVLETTPSSGYIAIARIVATGSAGMTETQVLAALEQKARELGANGIVVENKSTTSEAKLMYSPAGGQYAVNAPTTEPKFIGLAIHVGEVYSHR